MAVVRAGHKLLHQIRRCAAKPNTLRNRQNILIRLHMNRYHTRSRCSIYNSKMHRIMYKHRQYILSRHCSNSSSPSNNSNPNKVSKPASLPEVDDSKDDDFGYFKMMPRFRNIHHWDKYEWIFTGSSLLQFLGFLSYDYTLLRGLSLLSASGMMIAHTGRRFFVGWFWAFSFAAANIIALWYLLREKYSHDLGGLSQEETNIYFTYFEPFAITPLEYKHIVKIGHIVTMARGETLTVHGLISDNVFLILSGQCIVLNDLGEPIGVINGGNKKSFVGEIALIDDTQDEATATVKTDSEQCRLLIFNVDVMKYFLNNAKAELRVKLTNVFTSSMKLKLMAFNDSFNVEKSIEFNQKALESLVQMLLISKGKIEIIDGDNEDHEGRHEERCNFVTDEDFIPLSAEEQMFLDQYINRKQINDQFVEELFTKYHIESK